NNNKNIFYKISIYKKYHVSICTRSPNDNFLLFLNDINNIFEDNSIIVSEKKYQYIDFSFDSANSAITFLNMIILGTLERIKNINVS
ncbi:hypothetical protein, partial [uncultured Mailhella sp.]|uniref:hypothetical protein n=1 Tax=uncultured Mailhella sp. TaxID=1981031 RepID=UPI0025F795E0